MAYVDSREVRCEQANLIVIIDASCEHEIGLILEELAGDTIEGADFRRTKRGKKPSRLRNSPKLFLIMLIIGNTFFEPGGAIYVQALRV